MSESKRLSLRSGDDDLLHSAESSEESTLTSATRDLNSGSTDRSCAPCSKGKASNCDLLKLSGTQSCTTTATEKIYCWNLIVENCSNAALNNVQLALDIRSFQTDQPFQIGPGVFGPALPPTATYLIAADPDVTGTANTGYGGTGTFYTASKLPKGASDFTVCATFALPSPTLAFTQVLPSPFSVKPQSSNFATCSDDTPTTETVFVSPSECQMCPVCPAIVEWDQMVTNEPPNPCVDCSVDGRLRFALETTTGCITHICIDGVWTCIGATPTCQTVVLYDFATSAQGWQYIDNVPNVGVSWSGNVNDWSGNPNAGINIPVPPGTPAPTNWLQGYDRAVGPTNTFITFAPAVDWSTYLGRNLVWDWYDMSNDGTAVSRAGTTNVVLTSSDATALTAPFTPNFTTLDAGQWQTVTVPLTGAQFSVTDAALNAVLADLVRVEITIETITGRILNVDGVTPATAEVMGVSRVRIECA